MKLNIPSPPSQNSAPMSPEACFVQCVEKVLSPWKYASASFPGVLSGKYEDGPPLSVRIIANLEGQFIKAGWSKCEIHYCPYIGGYYWSLMSTPGDREDAWPLCGTIHERPASTFIRSIEYLSEYPGTVRVVIRAAGDDSRTYIYSGVPFTTFINWTHAESLGKFFNSSIKNKFPSGRAPAPSALGEFKDVTDE